MDLFVLDDSFQPIDMIQGWDTLIWTERFFDPGEFLLKTPYIEETRALLPEKTYVSLRDTEEVMYVENSNIRSDSTTGETYLEVSGRSFEAMMYDRVTFRIPVTGTDTIVKQGLLFDSNVPAIASLLISTNMAKTATDSWTRVPYFNGAQADVDYYYLADPVAEEIDYTPQLRDLYNEVYTLIKQNRAGIRNRRLQPEFGGPGLYMEFYRGKDRSVNQIASRQEVQALYPNDADNWQYLDPIIFSVDEGYLIDPEYLWTIKDYKNVAYVVAPHFQRRVFAPGVSASTAGKDLKILYVEASDITDGTTTQISRMVQTRGRAALAKQNQTFFFDGEVSPDSPYKRGRTPFLKTSGWPSNPSDRPNAWLDGDYDLGDLVTLMGRYGVSQTMQVTEFVRTEDALGERGFPTLAQPIVGT